MPRGQGTSSPLPSIAWMAPARAVRTTVGGPARPFPRPAVAPPSLEGRRPSNTRRPASATVAPPTATGRSEWVKRLR